ncbi:tetratricopeptide repeat protein [Nonomuraea dietziae]|uniref:tetratricopeptide repeat protein n=1 Tax=Nonomuraea dietziae TaxID=65515 RepID=UPI0031E40BEA
MAAALRAFEEVGDRWWTAKTLIGMAQIHALDGEHDKAVAAYERSIAIATHLRSQDEVLTRLALAIERMRGGDLKGARHAIETAERAAWDRGQLMLEIEVAGALAELYRRGGEVERGRSGARSDGQARPRAHPPGRDDAEQPGPRPDGEPPHRRGGRTRPRAVAARLPGGPGEQRHPIGRPVPGPAAVPGGRSGRYGHRARPEPCHPRRLRPR